jgi:hypothetical protein
MLLMLTTALLGGCNTGTTVAEGGIGGTGVSMGRVAQVGSVYVNGIHYNTDNASFVVNGATYDNSDSHIAVGMVVRVTGTIDIANAMGIADSVVYDSLVIGPVDSIYNATLSHIGVMGQVIHINADTVFENTISGNTSTLQTLPLNALVEISGFPDSMSGEILATRAVLRDATSVSTYRVSGIAGPVDPLNPTQFTIGGLTIDAAAVPYSIPAEGTYVMAEGSLPPDTRPLFTADSVSVVDTGTVAADGQQVNIEGVITSGLDANDLFTVNGQVVDASLTTLSGDTTQLAAGRIVEVRGVMNGSTLLAESIEVEASSSQREEIGTDLAAGAVDLNASTVTLMGQTVHVTNSTILENDHEGQSTFSLRDLKAGDYLEAKVYDNNGVLTATKLELGHSEIYDSELEGYPSQIDADHIEILGVRIDISGITYTFQSDQRIVIRGHYDSPNLTLVAYSIAEKVGDSEESGD